MAPADFYAVPLLAFTHVSTITRPVRNPAARTEGADIGQQLLRAIPCSYGSKREAIERIAEALHRFSEIKPEFIEEVAAGIGETIAPALRLGLETGECPNTPDAKKGNAQ